MLRRACVYLTYTTAAAAGIGSVLMLIGQFIDWLQGRPWPNVTLLRLALEYQLIPRNWPRFPELANAVFTVLHAIPLSVCLLVLCPLLWALAVRMQRAL
jgi:hypothetical protein